MHQPHHTFSPQSKSIAQGSTYNLMDYTAKTPNTTLRKYQWQVIHNPRISIFGGEEEEVSEDKKGGIVVVGNNEYINNVWHVFSILANTQDGANLLKTLAQLKIHIIIFEGEKKKNSFKDGIATVYNKYYISFNPIDFSKYKTGENKYPASTFGHEVSHLLDFYNYLNFDGLDPNTEVVDKNLPFYEDEETFDQLRFINNTEIDAVHIENIIRQSLGKKLREKYNYHGQIFFVMNKKMSLKKMEFSTTNTMYGKWTVEVNYLIDRNYKYSSISKSNATFAKTFTSNLKIIQVNPKNYELNEKLKRIKFKENAKAFLYKY